MCLIIINHKNIIKFPLTLLYIVAAFAVCKFAHHIATTVQITKTLHNPAIFLKISANVLLILVFRSSTVFFHNLDPIRTEIPLIIFLARKFHDWRRHTKILKLSSSSFV